MWSNDFREAQETSRKSLGFQENLEDFRKVQVTVVKSMGHRRRPGDFGQVQRVRKMQGLRESPVPPEKSKGLRGSLSDFVKE